MDNKVNAVKLLVTGGAGYIGSHTVASLLTNGHDVTILDDLSNSTASSIRGIEQVSGRSPHLVVGDIRDGECLDRILRGGDFGGVLHFAGLKAVGESVRHPARYYSVNVGGSIELLAAMRRHNVRRLVFSSSATVYDTEAEMPLQESSPSGHPGHAYGRSKQMVEQILTDEVGSDPSLAVAVLRYFNPVGAHPEAALGEAPTGTPNNLVPYIAQVAAGIRPYLEVYGGDYPTPDGTGMRDYVHVMDLARGHVLALDFLCAHGGLHKWNLGAGRAYSVLEVVKAFELARGQQIPYRITGRRPGDAASYWADVGKAARELRWTPQYTLEDMVRHAWAWQQVLARRV
ncbi:UDP-glucose 4-epimerase GalE [Isoalcanivorax indicus]|uniref:UDP-glucose 4-epimerase GalE n=1 Tax=Isoalcanivorax indicus TaxID=2202653 RepID=UPI001FEA07FB|nr:UDP-glucose 4-epimerase GalE [Isoalcanivorax indicus]